MRPIGLTVAGVLVVISGLVGAGEEQKLMELRGKIVNVDVDKSILRVAILEEKTEVQKEFRIGEDVRLTGGPEFKDLKARLRDKHFKEGAPVLLFLNPTTMAVREIRVEPFLPKAPDTGKKAGG
jgi:hypothetical protein